MQNLCYFLRKKTVFVKIYELCREIRFVVIYALLCGEKFIQKILCGEEMTNMTSAVLHGLFSTDPNLCAIVTERKLRGGVVEVKEREAGAPISGNSGQLEAACECITRPNNFARSHSL